MKILLLLFSFVGVLFYGHSQNLLQGYEYWFDNDYASKVITPITPTQQLVLNTSVTASSLTDGIHTFNFRTFDSDGMHSSVLSQFFYKVPESLASASNDLIAYEYWFDNDYASAQLIATPVQSQVQLNELISATALTDGIHTFSIRFKDESGMWSSVLSQFFYKIPESVTSATNDLIAYEYWFDNDYASAQLVATPVQSQVQLNELISATALTNGIHTFSIRFKDESGMWSSVLSQFFYKIPPVQTIDNYIVAYRYWLDDEFQDAIFVQLPTAVQQLNLVDNLDFTMIPKDEYLIHFQFKDTLGFWSSVLTDTIVKAPLPIPIFEADSTVFCDAGTVQFINNSIDGDTYLWDFGDGNTSNDTIPIHTYSQPGTYTVSLTAYDLTVPIDSTVVEMDLIVVFETPDASLTLSDNDTLCEGMTVDISAVYSGVYEWSTGENTQTITVEETGDFWLNIAHPDFTQCNQNSDTIQITVIPMPVADFTFLNNDYEVTFANNSSAASDYFWDFGDGNTSTDTDPMHTYSTPELFEVYLVASSWCGSDTMYLYVDLEYLSLDKMQEVVGFKLYPNPSSGIFFFQSELVNETYAILDAQGRIVKEGQLSSVLESIDLTFEQTGVYYMVIQDKIIRLLKH